MFAPVGARYKMQYYFPDLGFIGYEHEYTLVLPDESQISAGDPIPIYPGITEGYGEDIVEEHFQNFQAEVLWQVADVWPLSRIPDLAKQDRIKWVVQPPVDFLDPIPQYMIDKFRPALKVVPWVQDGTDRLRKAGLTNVADPIPIGINTDIWKPQDRSKSPDTMKQLGFGYDTFNIAMIAANQFGRKSWEHALKGIKIFREKMPDVKVRLYIHTHMNLADGWDMTALLTHLGLADITVAAAPYQITVGLYQEAHMMLIHALADVVINCGLEGFGLSTVQANAVGTPVIGLKAGPTPELMRSGILVPVYNEVLTQAMLTRAEPHPLQIAEALNRIHNIPRSNFQEGVKFAQNFAWPIVIEKWRKLFLEVEQDLERNCVKSRKYPPSPSGRALTLATNEVNLA